MITNQFRSHIRSINTLVNCALASAKIKKLEVEEENGLYMLRPQLHVILNAPTGSLKSTVMGVISRELGVSVHDAISSAGLVGTIDNMTKQFIPGTAWTCRNSLLLMDEFKLRRKGDDWQVFLKILEEQRYSKKLGIYTSDSHVIDNDLELLVKSSEIRMRTRFAAIIATMKRFEAQRSDDFKAFVNRCVTYQYSLNIDEIEYILKGKKFFQVQKMEPREHVVIKAAKYRRLMRFVRKNIPKNDTGKENFARAIGDVVRLHAVTNNMNARFYRNIIEWKIDSYDRIGLYFRKKSA